MTEILHEAAHLSLHVLLDTLKTFPILFAAYLIIEIIEHKAMDKLRRAFASERLGVLSAAALGLFPQCGFSAAAANLYSEHLITAGTVAAVFVSTSDEAFPILAANPGSAKWFLPLLAVKFVWAIVVGFAVNFIFRLLRLDYEEEHHAAHHHGEHYHEGGEHHHCKVCDSNAGIFKSALLRSLEVFAFILVTGLILEFILEGIGEEKLGVILMTDSILQPVLAALIGLIPSCCASVVLAELFVEGTVSFGALAAGLSAGAGVGMLVLFRSNRNMKQNFAMLGLVYLLSVLLGVVLQLVL